MARGGGREGKVGGPGEVEPNSVQEQQGKFGSVIVLLVEVVVEWPSGSLVSWAGLG